MTATADQDALLMASAKHQRPSSPDRSPAESELAREIIQAVDEPALILDGDLSVVLANDAFFQAFDAVPLSTSDRSRIELPGGPWSQSRLRQRLAKVLSKRRRVVDFQFDYEVESSGRRTLLINARPLSAASGSRTVVLLRDVTERNRLEEERRALRHEFEQQATERTAMLGLLGDVALAADRTTDVEDAIHYGLQRVIQFNGWRCGHAWLPAADRTNDLLPGYAWYDESSPRYDKLRECISQSRVQRGESLVGRAFASGKPQFTNDVARHLSSYRAPLAECCDLRTVNAFPILVRQDAVGVLEFFSDETVSPTEAQLETMTILGLLLGRVVEREEAARSLRESATHYRTVVEMAGSAIIGVSRDFRIFEWNQAAEQIFGWQRHEALGRSYLELLFEPRSGDIMAENLRRELGGEPTQDYEGPVLCRSGTRRTIAWNVSRLMDKSGDPSGIIAIGQDVTERKALEKRVVEAVADEQRRIGQDIHDGIGQELTGLRHMAQTHLESLARQASPDEKTAGRMIQWLASVQRRLRSTIQELVPVEVHEKGLVAALGGLAKRTSELHELSCTFECEGSIVVEDTALATHLYRIAQEAINNAVHHARPSHIAVHIAEDGNLLRLQVADNGIGIHAETDGHHGFGLRIMDYRARLIDAKLRVEEGARGGTVVLCVAPKHPTEG